MNDLAQRGPLGFKSGKPTKKPRQGLPPVSRKRADYRKSEARREESAYCKWLHEWKMCCLSGRPDIQVAHTSDVADGKGMAIKGPIRHALPLSFWLHLYEERNRSTFWPDAGFPCNERYKWAERLFDIFEANDDPTTLFLDMQDRANKAFLADILRKGQR